MVNNLSVQIHEWNFLKIYAFFLARASKPLSWECSGGYVEMANHYPQIVQNMTQMPNEIAWNLVVRSQSCHLSLVVSGAGRDGLIKSSFTYSNKPDA